MATVPTVSNQWIPEDDLLLKNAAEAGASLEALAKGAIQFSRRYTLRELQERWYSLLYDPVISAQASARIFELEISGVNPVSKLSKLEKEVSNKRKCESIRRKYYAMRKRLRNEFLNNGDLCFFESNPHEFGRHDAGFQNQAMSDENNPLGQNCMIGDSISDQLELQEEDLDILRHAFPGTMKDTSGASNRIMGGYGLDEGGNNILEVDIGKRKSSIDENPHSSDNFPSFQRIVYASEQPHLRHLRTMQDVSTPSTDVDGKENSSSVYTGEFADPDSLLNLSNEDEMLLEEVDEQHAGNKRRTDITDSVVRETNKDGQDIDIAKGEHESVTLLEGSSVLAPTVDSLPLKADVPSEPSSVSDSTELCHDMICCTLNTEDTEIPCNDDIFLLIHPPMSFESSPPQPNTTASMDPCEKDNGQDIDLVRKGKDSTKACLRDLRSVKPLGGKNDIPGFVAKTVGNSSEDRSLFTVPKPCSSRLAKKEVARVDMKVGNSRTTMVRSMEAGSATTQLPESLVDDSVSDLEESQIDNDVPYFSDVEAMILDMDLDPDDQDTHIARQVPSYQYDDTKRTIIRLEQAARSCLQRVMTSQGALAILYGRHLRHYIKKPEVLLGRSTDDLDVDIDLRKEGRANKISRRQAIIKMEADGSFFVKNLGKSPVSVNGMAVATGQLLNLSPICLMEIKGMSFVFEINQGYVRRHLGNFYLKNKGKSDKSDWSAEGES
ncbi:hypothetical protein OROHE_000564 [Orobanche hederae]